MPTPRAGYRTADGQKRASVTTILGRFKDSGGLIKWAYGQGRQHENLSLRGSIRSAALNFIKQAAGLGPLLDYAEKCVAHLLGQSWREPLEEAPAHLYDNSATTAKAALAGTIAHHLVDAHIRNGEDTVLEAAKEYADAPADVKAKAWNAYQQFKKWLANTKMKIVAHERPLVSEVHGFGGTPDATGYEAPEEGSRDPDGIIQHADGTYTLVDWKTSNKVYGDMIIQLAAYAILIEETEGIVINSAHLLRFAKETADFAHHYYGDLTQEKKAFLLMRELYDIVYAVERRA